MEVALRYTLRREGFTKKSSCSFGFCPNDLCHDRSTWFEGGGELGFRPKQSTRGGRSTTSSYKPEQRPKGKGGGQTIASGCTHPGATALPAISGSGGQKQASKMKIEFYRVDIFGVYSLDQEAFH